jgi:magnesium transporter|tara:strand:- start:3737 stop:5095 length:1359 start_codon:yes stop_codon:yes gene_type:complete
MQEITKEYLYEIQTLIEQGEERSLVAHLDDLHETDIALILNQLRRDDVSYAYRLLKDDIRPAVLSDVDDEVLEEILSSLSSKEIAEDVIDGLESDDAADIIGSLPTDKRMEVMSKAKDKESVSDVLSLLSYPEGSAGALMAKELVKVEETWTVATAIKEIRVQAQDIENIYTIYVVDSYGKLTGRLSLQHLLLTAASTRTPVGELKDDENIISIKAKETEDLVVSLMERYDLVALPVTDNKGILLGRITIDDAVDVIIEEAERDYQLASGISEDVESYDSVWTLTRARLPWLLIGLGGGVGGAYVIGAFDIVSNPEMALFIPLIAAMGGNVGVQSSAIVVQGLATASINTSNIATRLMKELGVGLLNGIICASIIFIVTLLLGFDKALSATVGISLLCVIVFAALFGAFVPLMLEKRKIDPALATGPFITTANDIIGLIIYFSVGSYISTLL